MASSASLTTTHLPILRGLLDEWREKQTASTAFATPVHDIAARLAEADARTATDTPQAQPKDIVVAFRTRPPLPNEAADKFHAYESREEHEPTKSDGESAKEGQAEEEEKADAPVEFCAGVTAKSAEPGTFVAHVPGYKWSGPTLTHKSYDADVAFGPDLQNEEVYQRTVVANDMIPLALSSGIACIVAYGQTGSGKTYTMEALEHRIACDLFVAAKHVGARLLRAEQQATASAESSAGNEDVQPTDVFEFTVTFLELLGKRAVDLLEPADGLPVDAQGNAIRKEVAIHEDKNGDVRPRLISRIVTSSEQLDEVITSALSHRRTSATLRNATSSRSHAVLTITIKNKLLPFADPGQLLLVDLAGSERYEDSKAHDKQRMLESRENNNSLMNLKECVRAKAKMATEEGFVHIPWRSNKLTMLLKPIFDIESRQPSKTLIIAHVSPHIQDTVHSVNTLSYAAPFKTAPPKPRGPAPYDPADPRTWTHEQTATWLTTEFTKRSRARHLASYEVAKRHAALNGKKLRPYDADAPMPPAIDVVRLCPPGMTARHYGAMYTIEFVQRCLECATIDSDFTVDIVKAMAAETVGRLTYLILSAKSRKRKAIMSSRKVMNVEAYGASPFQTIPGTNIRMPDVDAPPHVVFTQYTPEQFALASQRRGSGWYDAVNLAVTTARNERAKRIGKIEYGGDIERQAEYDAVMRMMEEDFGPAEPSPAVQEAWKAISASM